MLQNYLRVFLRHLVRQKTFSLINLTGLSIGIVCFLLISLYVTDEWSFDRYHPKSEQIYRIITHATYDGQTKSWGFVPNKVATTAVDEIPEVQSAARILYHNFSGQAFVSYNDTKFLESNFVWADSTLFDIIKFQFLEGGIKPLSKPNSIIVSESTARKYFNSTQVIGKTLKIDNNQELEVTGVYADQPSNTVFQYPMIGSFQSCWAGKPERQSWSNASFNTFLLLDPGADAHTVDKKLQQMIERNVPKEDQYYTLSVLPLRDNYLYTTNVQDFGNIPKGDIKQLQMLIALAIAVLLVAAVNYVNMTTAQAQRRQKEIGINKTLGATRTALARKFYLETTAFVFTSLIFALGISTILLPIFNQLSSKNLTLAFMSEPLFWIGFAGLGIVLSLIAGIYPSIYLSAFSPKQALKSSTGAGENSTLRKVLVVGQFSVSIILIVGTIVLFKQMQFMRDKKLGFQPEQVISILTTGADKIEQLPALKNKLKQLRDVENVAQVQAYPGKSGSGRTLSPLDGHGEPIGIQTVTATPEVVDVLKLELLAGKTLPEKAPNDTTIQIILNKKAIDFLGLSPEDAIGRKVDLFGDHPAEIVGVVGDFHYESLHTPIGAYCFHNANNEGYKYLIMKVQTTNLVSLMSTIETEFKKIIPTAFEYSFLDSQLASMYRAENQLLSIVIIFSVLSIFIACLGLYALTSYTVEQRIKEIGVRKVLGASVFQISNMLSKDFLVLVGIAILIAIPVSHYLLNKWLQNFYYKTDVNILSYITAIVFAILIASITVATKTIRAASQNPVNALKVQ